MQDETPTYRLKVDASGRVVLPAEARARKHIAEGDTVIITEDDKGLRIRTRDEVLADAQAFYAQLVPPGVSLSEEILQDRRSEIERDS